MTGRRNCIQFTKRHGQASGKILIRRGQLGIAVQYYSGWEVYDILKAKPALCRPQQYADIGSDDF